MKFKLKNGLFAPPSIQGLLNKVIPSSLLLEWREGVLQGYGDSRNGKNWAERSNLWNPPLWVVIENEALEIEFLENRPSRNALNSPYYYVLPVFENYLEKVGLTSKSIINGEVITINAANIHSATLSFKEETPMNKLTDYMAQLNTKAAKTTATMATGRAANQMISSALARSFPWYARLMGKHKEVTQNPLARLGTAEAVAAAVKQFAPHNQKLKFVAEAMVEEAMVDVAINSEVFKGLIKQLEGLAETLPTVGE